MDLLEGEWSVWTTGARMKVAGKGVVGLLRRQGMGKGWEKDSVCTVRASARLHEV